MPLELLWQSNPRATVLHALRLLANETPMIDHSMITLLTAYVPTLRKLGLDDPFWRQLLPIASRDRELSPLVHEAIQRSRLDCPAKDISQLLTIAEQQVLSGDLDVREELRLRQRPLRELWEAGGPGMLFQISRWTMHPTRPRIEVDGLLPLCGGFGQAFPETERVQIELVLTNPATEVPEVIRLAWLIAQLSTPADSDLLGDRLALVPCCLAAAEQLGLAICHPTSLTTALRNWRVVDQREDELGLVLHQWWTARNEDQPWIQSTAQLRSLLTAEGVSDR